MSRRSSFVLAIVLDLLLVIVFVLIGRASHGERLSFAGILETLWPFLVGLVVGWLITRVWRAPFGIVWPGIGVWLATLIVGMLLRFASGQGIAVAFIIVATIVLGVFLIGWRAIAAAVARFSPRARQPS